MVLGARVVGVVNAEAVTFAWREPRGSREATLRVVARVDGAERKPLLLGGRVDAARAGELPGSRREPPERVDFTLARDAMEELVSWVARHRRAALRGAPSLG